MLKFHENFKEFDLRGNSNNRNENLLLIYYLLEFIYYLLFIIKIK